MPRLADRRNLGPQLSGESNNCSLVGALLSSPLGSLLDQPAGLAPALLSKQRGSPRPRRSGASPWCLANRTRNQFRHGRPRLVVDRRPIVRRGNRPEFRPDGASTRELLGSAEPDQAG